MSVCSEARQIMFSSKRFHWDQCESRSAELWTGEWVQARWLQVMSCYAVQPAGWILCVDQWNWVSRLPAICNLFLVLWLSISSCVWHLLPKFWTVFRLYNEASIGFFFLDILHFVCNIIIYISRTVWPISLKLGMNVNLVQTNLQNQLIQLCIPNLYPSKFFKSHFGCTKTIIVAKQI